MSNIIPPLLSSTPPPIGNIDDEDDDFGDFTTAVDYPYGCDSFSIPNTPQDTPKKSIDDVDINSNSSLNRTIEKDHQDKRKYESPVDQPPHLPNFSTVPSDLNTDFKETSGSAPVPEVKDRPVAGDQNVPSYQPTETEDVYREEPPEIIPDDPDDEFGDFEYNAGLSIENEDEESNIDMSIPVNNDFPDEKVCSKFVHDINEANRIEGFVVGGNEKVKEINEINIIHSTEITVKSKEIFIRDDDFITCKNDDSVEEDVKSESAYCLNSENLFNGEECKSSSEDDDDFGDFEFTTTNIDVGKNETSNIDVKNVESSVVEDSTETANHISTHIKSTHYENTTNLKINTLNSSPDLKVENLNDSEVNIMTALNVSEDSADSNPMDFNDTTRLSNSINLGDNIVKNPTDLEINADLDFNNSTNTPKNLKNNTVTNDMDMEVKTLDTKTNTDADIPSNDDFSDFADFTSIETKNITPTTEDEDFGDFVTTTPEVKKPNDSPVFEATFPSFDKQEDDEFGDFDDYTSASSSTVLTIDSKNVSDKAKLILEEMFEVDKVEYDDYHTFDFIGVDGVFKEMKDITDTNALRYQWAKSQSQKELLKSLNIDTRNILYGPGINSMPKFAANLGLTPLEPMKPEILAPTQIPTPSTSSQSNPAVTSADIPTAQFDWSESGLANPLDSAQASTILLDLEQLVASLDKTTPSPTTQIESAKSDLELDDWNNWLQSVSKTETENFTQTNATIATPRKSFDNESVNSLQFAEIPNEEDTKVNEEDEFSDFTSFKPSWSNNMVPLRESYINNMQQVKKDSEEPGWLKPTILTPVLPRKENDKFELEEDEFTDFQASLPATNSGSNLTVLPVETNAQKDEADVKNVPFSPSNILQPVQIFKPSETIEPTMINWPDPGITEEELARFEMYSKSNGEVKKVQRSDSQVERKLSGNTGLMLVEKSVVVPANKVVLPSKEVLLPPNDKVVISKDLVLPILESSPRKYIPLKNQPKHDDDDDDWTDFISNPEPVKPVSNFLQPSERTATPELPLSIPQLSHIQPPKLPIPVITPQGLMQTKIPSVPVVQAKHIQAPLHLNPPQDGYQPAIISHQYAMQMNPNTFSGRLQNTNYQTTSIPANMRTPTHQQSNGIKSSPSFDDSDEWSDFVSSRPSSKGLPNPLSTEWNRSPHFSNWNNPPASNVTPNSAQYPQFKLHSNGMAHSIKNNIPSISALPDLDFVAPKTRTYNKK